MLKTMQLAIRLFTTVRNFGEYLQDRQGLLKRKEFTLKLRNGITILLRAGTSDRFVFNDIWLDRAYALPGLQYNTFSTVIDIGAHIGLFSLFAAQHSPQATIFAYEPEPDNFRLLQENISHNHFIKRIHMFQTGIGKENGILPLHVIPKRGECHSSYHQAENSTVFNMTVIRLQDIFNEHHIQQCDLLKMNCEGEEYNILTGLPDDYYKRIRTIAVNYHLYSPDPSKHPRILKKYLEERGFYVTRHLRNFFLAVRHANSAP